MGCQFWAECGLSWYGFILATEGGLSLQAEPKGPDSLVVVTNERISPRSLRVRKVLKIFLRIPQLGLKPYDLSPMDC